MKINNQSIKSLMFTTVVFSAVLFAHQVQAEAKWFLLGNTVWVSGDARLDLEMPSVFHPDLIVTSDTAADLQWIETTIPFTFGATIKQIGLCYQTPDQGTFISQIRLSEYLLPNSAVVKHDDGTDLISADGACYFSVVNDYKPNGSVNMSLRLNFANPGDEIHLGALGVLIDQ